MLEVYFCTLFSLVLLTVTPDPWEVRREIAKRQAGAGMNRGRFGRPKRAA
jgi:hypothetical protein